ncbi:unnamed protein product, partial [marine sediment metagenome]
KLTERPIKAKMATIIEFIIPSGIKEAQSKRG